MKYKNLQEKIENIDLDNLSEDDVLQIETTIKELISIAKSFDQSLIDQEIKKIKTATTVIIILLLLARILKLSNFNLFKFCSNRLLIDLLMFFKFLTNEFCLGILIKKSYKVLF